MDLYAKQQLRNMIERATMNAVYDDDTYQAVDARSKRQSSFTRIMRHQPYGFSAVPPAGTEGFLMAMGGNSSQAVFMAGEHPDHRPRGGVAGGTYIYNQHGKAVSLVKDDLRIVSGDKITLVAPKIALDGEVTLGGDHGSGEEVALLGSKDSAGHPITSLTSSKVKVVR